MNRDADRQLPSPASEEDLIAELDQIEIPSELLDPHELKQLSAQVKMRLKAAESAARRVRKSLKKEGFERIWDTFNGDSTKVLQDALSEIHHLAQLEVKMVLVGLLLAKKHNQSTKRLHIQQSLLADQQDELKSLQEAEAEISRQIHGIVSDLSGVRDKMRGHSDQISVFCQQMSDYVAARLDVSEQRIAEVQTGSSLELVHLREEWLTIRSSLNEQQTATVRFGRLSVILASGAVFLALVALVLAILR